MNAFSNRNFLFISKGSKLRGLHSNAWVNQFEKQNNSDLDTNLSIKFHAMISKKSSLNNFGFDVGHSMTDGLHIGQWPTECLSFFGVFPSVVLSVCDSSRRSLRSLEVTVLTWQLQKHIRDGKQPQLHHPIFLLTPNYIGGMTLELTLVIRPSSYRILC